MKIKGKNFREFQDVDSLAIAVEETLDRLAEDLQRQTVDEYEYAKTHEKTHPDVYRKFCQRANVYSDSVLHLNKHFGTDYMTACTDLKKHFGKPHPVKIL